MIKECIMQLELQEAVVCAMFQTFFTLSLFWGSSAGQVWIVLGRFDAKFNSPGSFSL
jgi:hypothetical protein